MLQKLRSRHPVDLPVEGFGRSGALVAIIGGLAVLAVIVPLVLAVAEGALTWAVGVAIGVGTIVVVFLLLGLTRMKAGYASVFARRP